MYTTAFSDFFERLKSVTPIKTQTQLAHELSVGRAAISLAKQKESVPTKWIFALAQKYSLNTDWLATGNGTPYSSAREEKGKHVPLPLVSPKISADGHLLPSDAELSRIAFHTDWLLTRGNPRNMVCMSMSGDCMEPGISNGDLLLIDQQSRDIYPGKLFVLAIDQVALVRRLDVLPGQLVLHCDNPRYPSEYLDKDSREQIHILGRIIWSCREYV